VEVDAAVTVPVSRDCTTEVEGTDYLVFAADRTGHRNRGGGTGRRPVV
jgi:hypothetical protein